jgi:hypothetical protein
MSQLTDQQLSPAAAQRILRSIAYWDWSKLDEATGLAKNLPVFIEAPAAVDVPALFVVPAVADAQVQKQVADDIKEDQEDTDDSERAAAPPFRLSKSAGGWYLNEVPEVLIAECERDLSTSDPLIDLTGAPGVGDEGGAADAADADRVATRLPTIGQSGGVVTTTGWFQLSDPT